MFIIYDIVLFCTVICYFNLLIGTCEMVDVSEESKFNFPQK